LQASQLGGNKQGNGTVEYSTPKVPLLLWLLAPHTDFIYVLHFKSQLQ
jgi:hypothetical protein